MTREAKKYVFNREDFLKLTTMQERNEYLRYADLTGVYVSGAYVTREDLDGAYVSRAYVSREDLDGARTKKTNVILIKNHDLK